MPVETVQAVIEALSSFEAAHDETENFRRLYQILEGFDSLPNRELAMPAMFSLMERFPEALFGSPGPLVHELEAIPGYQPLLQQSLARQPTDLTVWMVDRLLNSKLSSEDRQSWLGTLRSAAEHPRAAIPVRESALYFLQHQERRGNA